MNDKSRKGSKASDLAISLFQEDAKRRRQLRDLTLGRHDILEQARASARVLEEAGGAARIAEHFAESQRFYQQLGQQQLAVADSFKSLVDFPTLRLADDVAKQWAGLKLPHVEAAKSISASVTAMTNGLRQSMTELTAPSSAILAAQEAFVENERRLREAMQPLRSLMDEIGRQYAEFAQLVQGPAWQQLQDAIESARQDYVLHAEPGQFTVTGAEVSITVARVIEDLAPHQTNAQVLAALLGLLVAALKQVLENTNKEVRSMGLVTAFTIVLAIKSLEPQYTPEDRRVASETHQLVQRIETELTTVAEAEVKEHAYVESLPKAVVTGAGRVRENPVGAAKLMTKLPRGTVVGVSGRQDRWRRIVFRDELTHDLAEGWIYSASLQPLSS